MVESYNALDPDQIDTPRPNTDNFMVKEEVKDAERVGNAPPKKSMLAAAMENGMKDYESKVTLATEADSKVEINGDV